MKQGPCLLCTDSQLVRLSQSLFSFLNYRLIKVPTPSFSFPFTSLFHLRNAILSALSWRMGLGERAVKKPLGGMQGRSVTSHQPKGRHKQHLRQWRRRHFFLILGMGQGFLAVPWRVSSIRSEGVFEGKKRHKRRHHYGWCRAHRGTQEILLGVCSIKQQRVGWGDGSDASIENQKHQPLITIQERQSVLIWWNGTEQLLWVPFQKV